MEGCGVYVGNLPFSMRDEDLLEHFQEYGSVSKAYVMRDRETDRSRGYGYVIYHNEDDAKAAIERGNGLELNGRVVKVQPSHSKNDNRDNRGGGRDYNREGGGRRFQDDGNRRFGDRHDGGGQGYQGGRYRDDSRGGRFRDDSRGGRYRDDSRSGRYRDESRGGYRDRNYGGAS